MNTSTEHDVVVVGAGIVGICCALPLLEKGFKVTMIDRDLPAQAASSGNAGVISPWSNVPQCIPGVWKNVPKWLLDPNGPVAIRPGQMMPMLPWSMRFLGHANLAEAFKTSDAFSALNASSIDIYRSHLKGTGEENLLRDSHFVHVYRRKERASLDGVAWKIRARHNTPVQMLSAGELSEIEPALSSDYEAAILIKDQARAASPGLLGTALANKFQSMGGQLLQGAVHRLKPSEGRAWQLETELGEITTDKLVLAAGAWSASLLEPLGIRLPLVAERGYHMTFKNPGVTLNNSVMETDRLFVCSSMAHGVRSAGTSEFAGLDSRPNYKRARILKALTRSLIPDINTAEAEEWMGIRPSFPDNLPCIGRLADAPGLFAAFGHSHWGMSMAPKTGQVIADLVAGAPPDIDISPYRADRFA